MLDADLDDLLELDAVDELQSLILDDCPDLPGQHDSEGRRRIGFRDVRLQRHEFSPSGLRDQRHKRRCCKC